MIPAAFLLVGRRRLVGLLLVGALAAVASRAAIFASGTRAAEMIATVLLPTRADVLICRLLAAVAIKSDGVPWHRIEGALRIAPIVLLVMAAMLHPARRASGRAA